MSVIQSICDSISNRDKNLQDQFLRAAFCFEKFQGMTSDAWDNDILNANFSSMDVLHLKNVIEAFIKNNPKDNDIGTAIWSYGKVCDRSDREFLMGLLSTYLKKDPIVLYQVMCALDIIGEVIFSESSSIVDYEKNIRLASAYLDS